MSLHSVFARFLLGFQSVVATSLFVPGLAQAQSVDPQKTATESGTTQDCTDIHVDYADDPTLTNAEKRALMDRALFQSLNRFDACQTAVNGGSGGSGSGSGGGGGGGAAGGDGGATSHESVASSDMSGTQAPPADAQDVQTAIQPADDGQQTASSSTEQSGGLSNGKVPEDIPPANNDSVLEAQIRQAAMNEQDPETQAKLWNEYRRYKGLPTVK